MGCCARRRYGNGVVCKLHSVCLRTLDPEALTTYSIGRNISSSCNSSGSAIWASAKNIKSLVDANRHTEAIEFANHQSPIRFSPIYYQNPGSKSRSPSGQTILFGCPLELRTVGELRKLPPILEYLLDLVHDRHAPYPSTYTVGQKRRCFTTNSLYCKSVERWSLANEVEHAWTGVEESDRAIVSQLVQGKYRFLIEVCLLRYTIAESYKVLQGYLWALPKPVLSGGDIIEAWYNPPLLTWDTWSKDPIKKAVFVAITPWLDRAQPFRADIVYALAQNRVCFIHSYSLAVEEVH